MSDADARVLMMLRLHLTRGVGPTIGRRMLQLFRDPEQIFRASKADLRRVEGIGEKRATEIHAGLRASEQAAINEMERIGALGGRHVVLGDDEYPPLLAETPDAPLALSVLGSLRGVCTGHSVAVVGSRRCTAYGIEQTERFSAVLAQAGIAIISGGARGIDSAAHRAALRVHGCTVAVLGCGLAHMYPPENKELFDEIIERGSAIVSELPADTPPISENFPGRNRIISGLALGVLVVEAPKGSGALITAKHATEDHGREVFAIPGRIDSAASFGANELIQSGGAMLALNPGDVVDTLRRQAEHLHAGTRAAVYAPKPGMLFETTSAPASTVTETKPAASMRLTETQRKIWEVLAATEAGIDDLAQSTGIAAEILLADLTLLEVRRLIVRRGSRFARAE